MIKSNQEFTQQYLNWLLLLRDNPGVMLTPTEEIDEEWHAHIETEQYESDCLAIVGRSITHKVENSVSATKNCFKETQRLWKKTYGKALAGNPAICKGF